jgi:hypothetical protein
MIIIEIREYGRRDPSRWPRGTLYLQKSALTSSTSSGLSVGIVRSMTQASKYFSYYYYYYCITKLSLYYKIITRIRL